MARPRRIGPGVDLADILEKDWDSQLFGTKRGLCRSLGWNLCYHVLRSRGSQAGFPDRVLLRERVIFVELKRELTGKKSEDANRQPSDFQRLWLDGLARAGAEVYLWRPSDLDEAGEILGRRWTFHPAIEGAEGWQRPRLTMGDSTLYPRSAWVPGHGRLEAGTNDVTLHGPQEETLFQAGTLL